MGNGKLLCVFFLLLCSGIWAREVTDTLESVKRDRVILVYDFVQNNNGQVVIKFVDVKKKLGQTFKNKYKKLDEVIVLFFDRMGNYGDETEFSGISPEPFMIPSGVGYKISEDGYFLLNDNQKLTLELKSSESSELKIPIFIAHYEGRHRYKIFSRCEDLVIKMTKRKQSVNPSNSAARLTTQIISSQEEIDGSDADVVVANSLISRITGLLTEQDEYPFSDELRQAISRLREISYRPIDAGLSLKISEVLAACNVKEKELKNSASEAADAAAKNAELQAKKAQAQAQARQDSIAAATKQQADADRKQNLWLIIGGFVFAIFAFLGNQTLQYFRNEKNQKSIMDMQQNVVKRAENEAKRRARNMAQSQIKRIQGEARRKTRSSVNEGISNIVKKGKGNKGISI